MSGKKQNMESWNNTFDTHPAYVREPTEELSYRYYPDDRETSIWMYAMISAGSAFVIFVLVTLYLMCHSAIRQVGEQDLGFRATASRSAGYRAYHSDA